jgi:hypothetical protein
MGPMAILDVLMDPSMYQQVTSDVHNVLRYREYYFTLPPEANDHEFHLLRQTVVLSKYERYIFTFPPKEQMIKNFICYDKRWFSPNGKYRSNINIHYGTHTRTHLLDSS